MFKNINLIYSFMNIPRLNNTNAGTKSKAV